MARDETSIYIYFNNFFNLKAIYLLNSTFYMYQVMYLKVSLLVWVILGGVMCDYDKFYIFLDILLFFWHLALLLSS